MGAAYKLAWLAGAAGAVGLLFASSKRANAAEPAPSMPHPAPDLEVEPPVVSPEDIPVEVVTEPSKQLAAALVDLLWSIAEEGRGHGGETPEELAAIRRYQAQEGLEQDGLYGPLTGYTLIDYDLVPPPPFWWPKSREEKAKGAWRAGLLAKAEEDPARAEEWQQIAAV